MFAHSYPSPATGPVRTALAAAATALAIVAMLHWSVLVAVRIPSPSMQPTLLGSDAGDVHDRVLVDRLRYALVDPARWDLLLFHPPLQRRDTWLKRCVGLPGERIAIGGGNVHRVVDGDRGPRFEILRRSAPLVAAMWRRVHPDRAQSRGDAAPFAAAFAGEPSDAFAPTATGWTVTPPRSGTASLRFVDPDGGLVDRPWDGCPPALAATLRASPANASLRGEIVPDVRVAVRLSSAATALRCRLWIAVARPSRPTITFALAIDAGQLTLEATAAGPDAPSPRRSTAVLPAAAPPLELDFAHVDDELVAVVAGGELLRLDVGTFACRDGCALPDPCGNGPAMPTAEQRVDVGLDIGGTGAVIVDDLRIWRDQHWSSGPAAEGAITEVPADCYFVLGDNPHDSTDSRAFASVELWARDGAVVEPGTPGAQRLRGMSSIVAADLPPRAGENPVCIAKQGQIAFTDEFGRVHALRAPIAIDPGSGLPGLRPVGGDDSSSPVAFTGPALHCVPRTHLIGRAFVRCWPWLPWRPLLLR